MKRPLKNGSIARPEERGQQEPTDVGDLARTTRTPLENILKRSLTFILDLLYPRYCIACGQRMRKGGHYLCHTCEAKIMFIKTACTRCGAPFWGETDTRVCNVCRDQVLAFQSARSLFAYDGVGKELIHTFKYRNGRYLETDWIRLLKGQPDFLSFFTDATLVPVPLSKKKRHQRGFNQSERLAHCISKLTLAPIEPLLLKTRETPSQTQLNRQQRSQNVKNSFSLNPHMTLVPEKRYIVVDDVFTTGATLNACATTLKKAGATHISVATLAHG